LELEYITHLGEFQSKTHWADELAKIMCGCYSR